MPYLIIIPIVLFSVYYWYTKHYRIDALRKIRSLRAKPKPNIKKTVHPDFRCVVIKPKANACYSALQQSAAPVLMHEASALPLITCNARKCDCSYERFDDRRMVARRNDLHGAEQYMIAHKSRRQKLDRRKKEWAHTHVEHSLGQQTISLH